MMHMIETNLARAHARRSNMFCRVSADQNRLVFYTGSEAEPGTWLEAGSTMIDTSHGGAALVARHAVELIIGKHEYKEQPMPHWHDVNPWRDQITYVPIERLAECVEGGAILDVDGVVRPYNVAWLLTHWGSCGRDRLDAYILPQPHGRHSLGIRYGAEGSEYYSPHNAHPEKTQALLAEYHKPSPIKAARQHVAR